MTSIETKGRHYRQVQSLRDITLSNFPNGQIRYNWSIPSNESWNPKLSYFRMRYKWPTFIASQKSVNIGTLTSFPGAAPVENMNDSLWQQLEMRINGVAINKQDNYCHQIASLRKRMAPANNNKFLNDINFRQSKFYDRSNKVGRNGVNDRQAKAGWVEFTSIVGRGNGLQIAGIGNRGNGVDNAMNFDFVQLTCPDLQAFSMVGNRAAFVDDNDKFHEGEILAVTANTIQVQMVGGIDGAGFVEVNGFDINQNFPQGRLYIFTHMAVGDFSFPQNLQRFESIWQPCMGFWHQDIWLPGGDYEFIMTPFPASQYQKYAVETEYFHQGSNNMNFEVLQMELNVCVSESPATTKEISFEEVRCQAKTINIASLTQKQFNIHRKCHALTIAYQDNRVSSNHKYSSARFKIWDDDSLIGRSNKDIDYESRLSRFYIQFDGSVLPNPIPDIDWRIGSGADDRNQFLMQQYWETQKYKILQYDNVETFEEWVTRGPYYHFAWPRKNMNAVEVQVSQEFRDTLPTNVKPQLLLFEHYRVRYSLDVYNNYITGVKASI